MEKNGLHLSSTGQSPLILLMLGIACSRVYTLLPFESVCLALLARVRIVIGARVSLLSPYSGLTGLAGADVSHSYFWFIPCVPKKLHFSMPFPEKNVEIEMGSRKLGQTWALGQTWERIEP